MTKVIVSKEKCLHCLYGVTGDCEMYDEISKPCDGEPCFNFEEAGEDEMADGQRLANGDINVSDCIGFLQGIIEYESPDSMKSKYANRIVELLKDYQDITGEGDSGVVYYATTRIDYLCDRATSGNVAHVVGCIKSYCRQIRARLKGIDWDKEEEV